MRAKYMIGSRNFKIMKFKSGFSFLKNLRGVLPVRSLACVSRAILSSYFLVNHVLSIFLGQNHVLSFFLFVKTCYRLRLELPRNLDSISAFCSQVFWALFLVLDSVLFQSRQHFQTQKKIQIVFEDPFPEKVVDFRAFFKLDGYISLYVVFSILVVGFYFFLQFPLALCQVRV